MSRVWIHTCNLSWKKYDRKKMRRIFVKKSEGQSDIKVFHSKMQCCLPPATAYLSDVGVHQSLEGTWPHFKRLYTFVGQIKSDHKWTHWIHFHMSAVNNTVLLSCSFSWTILNVQLSPIPSESYLDFRLGSRSPSNRTAYWEEGNNRVK